MPEKEVLTGSVAAAEAMRDKNKHTGFAAGLYEAQTRFELLDCFETDKTKSDFKDTFEKFKKMLVEKVDPDEIDRTGEIPEEVFQALRDLTAFAVKVPLDYGGLGLTQSEYQKLGTLMGGWCGNTVALFSADNSLSASETLKIFGDEAQKRKWWPRLVKGEISALALTEAEAGCDVWNEACYAVPTRNEAGVITGYRLFGRKQWCTNAVKNDNEFLASIIVVVTRVVNDLGEMRMSDKELKAKKIRKQYGAFVVDSSSPGMRVIKRNYFLGLTAMYNGDFMMENVYASAEDRIRDLVTRGDKPYDNDGLVIALTAITTGRLTLPAACLGGMKQCLYMARTWAKERVQMGKPIGEYQVIADRVVRIASRVLALEAIMKLCGAWADKKMDIRMESMAAKILGSRWYWESIQDVFMIRAGRGFEKATSLAARGEHPWAIERMLRDAPINMVFEGANPVLSLSSGREGNADYIGAGLALGNRKLSMVQKAVAFVPMVKNFSKTFNWLTDLWPGASFEGSFPGRDWSSYLKRQSRLLTRQSILTIARHQASLQDTSQLALDDLAEWGMGLFAQAATLSYAHYIQQHSYNPLAGDLAEWFCRDVIKIRKGKTLWRRLFDKNNREIKKLATALMDHKLQWLEGGIIRKDK